MLRNPISRWLPLAGACLLAIAPFSWWGIPSGHDFEFHMFSWMEILGQWKDGIAYPRWAALAHWGYGEARYLFYPPASWTLGAALGAALPWKVVPGTYCWIVLMLSGASMYRLAREWFPASDALFAAVLYALNPYHLVIVYWRSAYAELLASPLLPLLLLCLLRLNQPATGQLDSAQRKNNRNPSGFREGHDFSRALSSANASALSAEGNSALSSQHTLRPTLWLSLLLAAAWLTNLPAAVIVHYSTAGLVLLFVAARTALDTDGKRWRTRSWRPLVQMATAMLLAAGLASFYLLPAIYEQRWINLSEVLSPGVRPQDNFLFTTIADPDHNRFNLLVSAVAIAEIGALALAIWFSRTKSKNHVGTAALGCPVAHSGTGAIADHNPWMLLSAWGAASAVLMLSISKLLWQHLPKLRFVQLPFRWLLCMNVAVAMLLTMAVQRWTSRLLACGVLLGAVILAGYRIQPPWWDTAGAIRDMSNAIADGNGYEGTDEYVPTGADPYELNQSLPRLSDDAGAPVPNQMLAWGPAEKHFTVHAATAQKLTVRLFNYPAWAVLVNGMPAKTQTTGVTGLMVIPIAAGDSDIQIHFRRTVDRLAGNVVSLTSLAVLVGAWIKTHPKPRPKKLV